MITYEAKGNSAHQRVMPLTNEGMTNSAIVSSVDSSPIAALDQGKEPSSGPDSKLLVHLAARHKPFELAPLALIAPELP
jgi:hypothetical protein